MAVSLGWFVEFLPSESEIVLDFIIKFLNVQAQRQTDESWAHFWKMKDFKNMIYENMK